MKPRPRSAEETIFQRPWTVLSFSSCSIRIDFSISSGLRPGHVVRTVITGRSTSGVSWIGMCVRAIIPKRTVRITPTATFTGFRIEKRMMSIFCRPFPRA